MRSALSLLALVLALGCATPEPPAVAEELDLSRYAGTWYEIASFPKRFQKGCVGTTATYTLQDDGTLRVENRCREGSPAGDERGAEGLARLDLDADSPAKLEVRFFWPLWSPYWILAVEDDYQHAIVGSPDRDSLWILSRDREISEARLDELIRTANDLGYDMTRLRRTPQGWH